MPLQIPILIANDANSMIDGQKVRRMDQGACSPTPLSGGEVMY